MQAITYSKAGNKATTAAKLSKAVFGVETQNQELLKQAYIAYLANGRVNLAKTKTRGLVRGGGKKPWKQKGTGRARFGSIRTPLWRGGGVIFGPTGTENYSKKITPSTKRMALRQALSLTAADGKLKIIESLAALEGKTKDLAKLLIKIEAQGRVLLVTEQADTRKHKAAANLPKVKLVSANYLTVYDLLNADAIVISHDALGVIDKWLGVKDA